MTYKQLKQVIKDPNTDEYFIGEVENILTFFEDENENPDYDEEISEEDMSFIKRMASYYWVALPKSEKDLKEEAEREQRLAKLRAERAARK